MVPALAHKGVYRWRCCVRGHAAHSSLTPQSVNAIEVGARVVGKLADMAARWRDEEPRYEGFDVPYSTGSVGVIEGGIADNVVPADCRFHYEFRNLPGSDVTAMQARGARLRRVARAGDARRRRRRRASASRRSARCRRSSRAPTIRRCCSRSASPPADATTLVAFGTEAGLFQRAGIADRRLRPGPHRAGAPGRRIRVARPARRGRALPARTDHRRRLSRRAIAEGEPRMPSPLTGAQRRRRIDPHARAGRPGRRRQDQPRRGAARRRRRDRRAGQRSSAAPRSATSTRSSGACSTRSTPACCT